MARSADDPPYYEFPEGAELEPYLDAVEDHLAEHGRLAEAEAVRQLRPPVMPFGSGSLPSPSQPSIWTRGKNAMGLVRMGDLALPHRRPHATCPVRQSWSMCSGR